jgi:hypothetical protein
MSRPVSPNQIAEDAPPLTPTNTRSGGRSRAGTLIRNLGETFSESRPPVGMFHAFGSVASNIPTLSDIETGNYNLEGWSAPAQRRNSQARRESNVYPTHLERQNTLEVIREPSTSPGLEEKKVGGLGGVLETTPTPQREDVIDLTPRDPSAPYENGYQFPPKHTKWEATEIALVGTFKFVTTPFGFLLTLYALNIVAWGGMLFLILIHAAPAMGHPSYSYIDSPAKKWLEIDSQILNALFCVTGLGLIPWRFRDFYYLLKWRYGKDEIALRRLAGIHRNWFRLQGSQELPVLFNPQEIKPEDPLPPGINETALAIPVSLSPDAPLTGERASPSKYWLLDFVIWGFVWNTFLQIALCGMMWGYNRYNRPSWSVGLLISLACIVASAAGWVIFKEGKRVKKVEGVPVSERDLKILKDRAEKQKEEGQSV